MITINRLDQIRLDYMRLELFHSMLLSKINRLHQHETIIDYVVEGSYAIFFWDSSKTVKNLQTPSVFWHRVVVWRYEDHM